MKKTITIAAYNRPDHLKILLDSLRAQLLPLDDYEMIISVDAGGNRFGDVLRVAKSVDFVAAQVFSPNLNLGTNHNTFWLMSHVFDSLGAAHNVYLEDDLILSPDAFNLVEWYIKHSDELKAVEGVEDIGTYCLCRLHEHGAPDKIYLSRAFVGWGFVMDAHQWARFGRPAWRNPMRMWDTSTAAYIRAQGNRIYNAFPELSRISNTGREGGVHFTPQKFDSFMKNHKYNQGRETYSFQFVGIK